MSGAEFKPRSWLTPAAGLALIAALAASPLSGEQSSGDPQSEVAVAPEPSPPTPAHVKARLRDVDERIEIQRSQDGRLHFFLRTSDGGVLVLTPEQFAERVFAEQSQQVWWNRLLNITSPVGVLWVSLGFLGQLLFTGRMLVQWLASERNRRSIVPPVFWWLSLGGASMLVVYFVWRKDVVGIVGQAAGWLVYVRNLWLIYHPRAMPPPASRGGVSAAEPAQS